MRTVLFSILLALAACTTTTTTGPAPAEPTGPATATSTEPGPAASTPEPATGHVAPPFSAAELRAGIAQGTEIKLRVESASQPTVIRNWLFTEVTDEGCTIAARVLAEDGTLVKDEGANANSWQELESHAHFPAALTTRSESSVTVPAGTFDTWLFEVQPEQAGGPVRRFHFAKELPGPPVSMEVEQDGQVITRMVLLARSQPTE